jgi:tetratricopeptide (TPR) repeat protein
MAAMPLLRADSLVVVDDSVLVIDDYPAIRVNGKGGLLARYALEVGAEMAFCKYQIGFTGITNAPPRLNDIDSLIARARACYEAKNDLAADRLYYLIYNLTPKTVWDKGKARIAHGEACAKFGYGAHAIRKWGTAIDWWTSAIEADPLASDYRVELVKSLVAFGAMDKALREATVATVIEPGNPRAWRKLGDVQADRRNAEASTKAYERELVEAMQAAPVDPKAVADALLNLATIELDTADYIGVRKRVASMKEVGERIGDAYHVEAMLEYRLSNHERAIELFDKALDNECRNVPLVHWDKALPLEAIGRLGEAGDEKCWNEFEMTVPAIFIPQHRFDRPKWRGESPITMETVKEKGKIPLEAQRKTIIHVHTEAGFGDNIALWRYFPLLLERGYEVHYECEPSLLSLCQRNFPDVMVMPPCLDHPGVVGIKPFDYHIPIGDLMHAMRAGFGIEPLPPMTTPYVEAAPELADKFLLVNRRGTRKIGLCWSSGIRRVSIWMERYGGMKSMRFEDVRPLLDSDDLFVSLQVGDGRDEIDFRRDRIIDILPEKPSWDETAALIAQLDLVITVDTGIAHLAGAMGIPCWVIMQRDGTSWHFMCERPGAPWNERSPWYPSIRVFRQTAPGDWRGAIEKVARALADQRLEAAE